MNLLQRMWFFSDFPSWNRCDVHDSMVKRSANNQLLDKRLSGPKALDLNFCKQQTLWLYDPYLIVLTVRWNVATNVLG